MTNTTRGQASVESMFVLGVLLMIFILLGYTVYKNYVKSVDLKTSIGGTRLANGIADHINDLNALGDGYSASFVLPASLTGGGNYTVNFYKNESSVFVEGGGFSTGKELRFSSPISTSRIHCSMTECNYTCNKSSSEVCLRVSGRTPVRLVKYGGQIHLAPEYNIIQGQTREFIVPFEGDGEVDLQEFGHLVDFAKDSQGLWNAIFVYHNRINNTLSLVFSMNLSNNENARINVGGIVGNLREVRSNDPGTNPEFNLDAVPPGGQWLGNSTGDVSGGSLIFNGGFSVCASPDRDNMPSQQWVVEGSDGKVITLSKDENVCISYP